MASRKEIFEKSNLFSWAAKIDFILNPRGGFRELDNANVSLLWNQDYILTLETRKIHPELEDSGSLGYRLTIDATDTACDAENLGLKLAYALLSVAIEKHWGMSLSWPDSPLPCRVIDRNASKGASVQGFGSVTSHIDTSEFISVLEDSFVQYSKVPYSLLLSMELCASSRIENSNRSKLIMLVSALEALAKQADLSDKLDPLIANLVSIADNFEFDDQSLKDSICGKIKELKRESIRRAIRRFLNGVGCSKDDQDFVEETYKARSSIVHEGRRVPELDAMNLRLDSLLRKVYFSKNIVNL